MRHIITLFALALLSACASVAPTNTNKSNASVEVYPITADAISFHEKSRLYSISLSSINNDDVTWVWSFALPSEYTQISSSDGKVYYAKSASDTPYISSYTTASDSGEQITNYQMFTETSSLSIYKKDNGSFSYTLELNILHDFERYAVNKQNTIMVPLTSYLNKEGSSL